MKLVRKFETIEEAKEFAASFIAVGGRVTTDKCNGNIVAKSTFFNKKVVISKDVSGVGYTAYM